VIQVHAPKISSISEGELHLALKCWSLRHNAHLNVFLLTENDLKKLLLQFFRNFLAFISKPEHWQFCCIFHLHARLLERLMVTYSEIHEQKNQSPGYKSLSLAPFKGGKYAFVFNFMSDR
jgi:hypothetical protein